MEGDCGLRRAPVKGLGSTSASAAFTFSAATQTHPGESRDPPFNVSGADGWVPAFAGTPIFLRPMSSTTRAMEWVPACAGRAVKKSRGAGEDGEHRVADVLD